MPAPAAHRDTRRGPPGRPRGRRGTRAARDAPRRPPPPGRTARVARSRSRVTRNLVEYLQVTRATPRRDLIASVPIQKRPKTVPLLAALGTAAVVLLVLLLLLLVPGG